MSTDEPNQSNSTGEEALSTGIRHRIVNKEELERERQWLEANVENVSSYQTCERCGRHVSAEFLRLFSGEDGRVHACGRCDSQINIFTGATVDPDFEPRTQRGSTTRHGERGIGGDHR